MADERNRLSSDPFSFEVRGGLVRISRGGTIVTTLGERASARQQLMARATGNYKRGNERRRRRTRG